MMKYVAEEESIRIVLGQYNICIIHIKKLFWSFSWKADQMCLETFKSNTEV